MIKSLGDVPLAEHSGTYTYQLGQQPKLPPQIKEKFIVVAFDHPSHSIYVGRPRDLLHSELRGSGASWIRPHDGLRMIHCEARVRPGDKEGTPCRVSSFENQTVRVEFEKPVSTIMAGQIIVFYDRDEVIGGAVIERVGVQPRD